MSESRAPPSPKTHRPPHRVLVAPLRGGICGGWGQRHPAAQQGGHAGLGEAPSSATTDRPPSPPYRPPPPQNDEDDEDEDDEDEDDNDSEGSSSSSSSSGDSSDSDSN